MINQPKPSGKPGQAPEFFGADSVIPAEIVGQGPGLDLDLGSRFLALRVCQVQARGPECCVSRRSRSAGWPYVSRVTSSRVALSIGRKKVALRVPSTK